MTLKETILLTHEYYNPGRPMSDQVLLMYASDLADLDEQVCMAAYEAWRRDEKNTRAPLPAQIRGLINPSIAPEALAREIAARIVGAITSHGWNNGKSAELFIGPVGWAAVQRVGGWAYLCENMGTRLSPTTFQAQVRDQIEANLRYGSDTIEQAIALPERMRKHGGLGLAPASDVIKKITGDYEPEGEGA